jgi:hypothetical protein
VASVDRLGPTRHNWVEPVERTIQRTLTKFPTLRANTYVDHPWPGWGRHSVDYWGLGGRGHAMPPHLSWPTANFLLAMPGRPLIRHLIVELSLWTSWGGWSGWTAPDHSGRLRHVHVTYWRPVDA